MGIAAQNLLKADLVGDAGMIKAALPVGKGDLAAVLEPRSDGGNLRGISEKALRGEHHVLVDVLALQGGQTAGATGHVGVGHAFGRDRGRRQLGDVNPMLCASNAIPLKPVVDVSSSYGNFKF